MRLVREQIWLAVLATLVCVSAASAEAVQVATLSGRVDVLGVDKTEWVALRSGSEVRVHDQVRTGVRGWTRLLLQDGSLVVVGPASLLRVEDATFDAPRSRVLIRLVGGQLRVVTGGNYPAQGRFEIETPTAVVTIPGTQCIVTYDTESAETQVVAVEGNTEVAGVLGVLGRPVMLEPRTMTTVRKSAFPNTPAAMAPDKLAELQARSSLMISAADTLLAGYTGSGTKAIAEAPSGRAGRVADATEAAAEAGPASFRHMRRRWLSRDAETIDQSIPEYQLTPAGQTPPGSITVTISGG